MWHDDLRDEIANEEFLIVAPNGDRWCVVGRWDCIERTDEARLKWRNEKRVKLNKKLFLLLLHFTFNCVVFFRYARCLMVCANMMNVLIKLTRSMWKPRSVHRRFPARCRCVQAFLLAARSWSYAILSYTDAHKTAPHHAYASRVDLDPSTCQHSNPLTRKSSQRDCEFVCGEWQKEREEKTDIIQISLSHVAAILRKLNLQVLTHAVAANRLGLAIWTVKAFPL